MGLEGGDEGKDSAQRTRESQQYWSLLVQGRTALHCIANFMSTLQKQLIFFCCVFW